ncbi:MAG: DEAD/DEAH box helicase family protein [Lachnospiraceae bacterium]|nr:DEAD/DEAH box helicase family protein [Lachnospiraceae bacterium]
MKFNFKIQDYQTDAVNGVAEVFLGQPGPASDRVGPDRFFEDFADGVLKNQELVLPDPVLLDNIRRVQAKGGLPLSGKPAEGPGRCSLDVEMETGTGKTYVYIKTMYELNRRYGWSKFIVVVPSVAIREGVKKSFEMTQAHFMEQYGKRIRCFAYDSGCLNRLDAFARQAGIQVMIINMQAFNTTMKEGGRSKAARIVYEERDEFGSRRPIDVIRACRPILILDEPQKMGGEATKKALLGFDPLFCLNYSATHKERHDPVYVLSAAEAYNRKLVKRIEVKGFQIRNFAGAGRYLYLERIRISPKHPPKARLEFEAAGPEGIRRKMRILGVGDDLYALSNGNEAYRGYRIATIEPAAGRVCFTNGACLQKGDVSDGVTEEELQRIRIRETILSHMEKEEKLFELGVKTLSLFFIDEVAGYREYGKNGEVRTGKYGRIFEEEYRRAVEEYLTEEDVPYQKYLRSISAEATHKGYFSVDKKGRAVNGGIRKGGDVSEDVSAYDLILKDKERLLSFEEPTRFLFSHSALREGWDNPNVFQICTLKHGNSAVTKRQEVGRGLRLCVNQDGVRMDAQTLGADRVHEVNRLTVIAGESYRTFAAELQKQIQDAGVRLPDHMIQDGNQTAVFYNERNGNFQTPEFCSLWRLLRRKYVYTANFDSEELIRRSVEQIDRDMSVARRQYLVARSEQRARLEESEEEAAGFFAEEETRIVTLTAPVSSSVSYDPIGKIAKGAMLTRKTAAAILQGIAPETFAMFRENPESFMGKAIRMIREQKALLTAEGISYRQTGEFYEDSIFTEEKRLEFRRVLQARKHIQDYVFAEGGAHGGRQLELARELDGAADVRAYAKLPKGFVIPTPAGDYSPEWAIAFCEGKGFPAYLIAETRGFAGDAPLSFMERVKRLCAEKFFRESSGGTIAYAAADSYRELRRKAGREEAD